MLFKADEAWTEFCKRPLVSEPKKKKGVLYIETDGSSVNTRIQDENGSTWRENKLAIFFSTEFFAFLISPWYIL